MFETDAELRFKALSFRRGPVRVAGCWLLAAGFWFLAACFGVWALSVLFSGGRWSFGRAVNAAMLVGSTLWLVRWGLAMPGWARAFRRNRLLVDAGGIHGQIGGVPVEIAWSRVRGIDFPRRGLYIVRTDAGPLRFSVLDIPNPKKAARAIRAHLPLASGTGEEYSPKKHSGGG